MIQRKLLVVQIAQGPEEAEKLIRHISDSAKIDLAWVALHVNDSNYICLIGAAKPLDPQWFKDSGKVTYAFTVNSQDLVEFLLA